jgi:hypothetical protein
VRALLPFFFCCSPQTPPLPSRPPPTSQRPCPEPYPRREREPDPPFPHGSPAASRHRPQRGALAAAVRQPTGGCPVAAAGGHSARPRPASGAASASGAAPAVGYGFGWPAASEPARGARGGASVLVAWLEHGSLWSHGEFARRVASECGAFHAAPGASPGGGGLGTPTNPLRVLRPPGGSGGNDSVRLLRPGVPPRVCPRLAAAHAHAPAPAGTPWRAAAPRRGERRLDLPRVRDAWRSLHLVEARSGPTRHQCCTSGGTWRSCRPGHQQAVT